MKNKLINQPIALTLGRYRSTIGSERIILRILESLQPHMLYKRDVHNHINVSQADTRVFTIKTKHLLPEGGQNYSAVKKSLRLLKSQEIMLRGSDKDGEYELFTGLIVQFKYYLNNEYVKIEVSHEVLNYLINNLLGYTRFSLNVAFGCSSGYTMRIYKMISHWRDKKNGFIRSFSIDMLRSTLNLGDRYVRPSGILNRVLEPAQKELKDKSDVWFEIKKPIKDGRKVIGWEIAIYKKDDSEYKSPRSKKTYKHPSLRPLAVPESKGNYLTPEEAQAKLAELRRGVLSNKKP